MLKRHFAIGFLAGLLVPALLIVLSIATKYVSESMLEAILVYPGFLPFASSDPEIEMSWLSTALAFILNGFFYGSIAVVFGVVGASRFGTLQTENNMRGPVTHRRSLS